MAASPSVVDSKNYASRFAILAWLSLAQLVRSPSHSRRAEAARRAARQALWLSAALGAAIIVLMFAIDAWEIAQMPKRGTPSLWWLRIVTDFGKDEYVLAALAVMLIAIAIVSPALRGIRRSLLLGLGTRLQFIFCAVALSNLVTEVLKYCVGRGRPFVGGEANAFHFSHFAGNPAYYSFPSGHATTAFALAMAVSAVWPQARVAMAIYALIIAASRLVLLAHHPSDVVAGAMVGIVGTVFVRYWFAARRLGFAILHDGSIVSLVGPSSGRLKRVARGAFAP
ncbi:phosphatase PAP2 family protein [Bradyrhizobium roseum]|uniref:phosphatase PAP2 family protein n=1 Tax=Bradyrhizobium roseum TaxID=3056648 RepID=UPI00260641A8|nr:phosphatase PAP2 family protein [Bradyrhizobium roseus]WKA25613.1 phosphatase PAP2 family protein [Bradyrhizobium roseus]